MKSVRGLNTAERKVLKAATTGDVVDLRTGNQEIDNLDKSAEWGDDRQVRATLLANLLTGDQPSAKGRLRSIKLRGARIAGELDLEDRKLLCPLFLQDCQFDEIIKLDGTEAISIRLPGCHIPALDASDLRVTRNFELNNGFIAHGETRLAGAHISGNLNFNGAQFNSGRTSRICALNADKLIVDQDMSCSEGFTAHREVRLVGAHISGNLNFTKASLYNDAGATGMDKWLIKQLGEKIPAFKMIELRMSQMWALNAVWLTVDRGLFCNASFTAHGRVNLQNAKAGVFNDGFAADWKGEIFLRGFTYARLGNNNFSTRARLQWLRRHPGRFAPQIYDQLADVYRQDGEDSAARRVLVAKQWRRRKPYNPLSWLWWVTVGYGYRTWQAFIWAAALTALGALVFSGAYPAHMIKLTAHPPEFQPVIYALDVLLPIGGLGQKSAWQPTGGFLDWYWVLAIAGWVLSAAVVAGLTGILKRD